MLNRNLLILILAITSLSFLQSNRTFAQDNSDKKKNLTVKIMPLSMVDFTPRLRLGLEFTSSSKLGYCIDLGIGNNFINHYRLSDTKWGQNYRFYEIRPEVKYLFISRKRFYLYSAAELFFISMYDHLESDYYRTKHTSIQISFDKATFHKEKYGMHLKGGINLIAADRFNFDFYAGLGLAKRVISYTNVVNPVESTVSIFDEWWPESNVYEGESTVLHLSLGVRMGYTFGKR